MKSQGAELVGQQEPRIRVAPAVPANDAADVIELCSAFGLELDEWQRISLEAGLGLREDGRWASDTVAICAPRQSGKGTVIEALALAGLLVFGQRTIACSAHEARTTRVSFERILGYFDNFDELRRRVKAVQRWAGREQIRLKDGSTILFPARSRGALRGFSCDGLILDEAQFLTASQYEAVLPTLSARPNPQSWLLGTVPSLVGDGEVLGRVRESALGPDPGAVCYLEWSADPGSDLDDRAAWAQANPQLGRRISWEAVANERVALTDQGFAVERLGMWPVDRVQAVISAEVWAGLAAEGPVRGTKPAAIAVDASPSRDVAIAAAWLTDNDRVHVELLATDHHDPLLALQFVVDLAGRRIPVVVDASSPAGSMVPGLNAQKVKTIVTGARDLAQACGGFYDDVQGGRLTHDGHPQLAEAVAGARKRPLGAAGLWGWDRASGSVFVSPLVAVTLARHGAVTAGRRRTGRATFV